MTDPSKENPHRPRRRWVFWTLLAVAVFAVPLALLAMLFAPGPPIRVAADTTFLTTPLADDGLPDYAAALLEEGLAGVTPDNNGAIPFLQAMWRGFVTDSWSSELSDEDVEKLSEALGVPLPPSPEGRMEAFASPEMKRGAAAFLQEKLREVDFDATDPANPDAASAGWYGNEVMSFEEFLAAELDDAAADMRAVWLLSECQPVSRPWTEIDLPFLAEWLLRNTSAIDLLHEAAERERWWLPPPDLIGGERGVLVAQRLVGASELRHASRMLTNHFMWRLGRGEATEAARCLATMLRLADHSRARPTVIDQLIAAAIEGVAMSHLPELIADTNTPTEALERLAGVIDGLDQSDRMQRAIDCGERYWGLDALVHVAQNGDLSALELDAPGGLNQLLANVSCDWNLPLAQMNGHYDEMVAAMRLPTFDQRATELERLSASLGAAAGGPDSVLDALTLMVSSQRRGRLVSDYCSAMFIPAVTSCGHVIERQLGRRQLCRLAIEVAIYQRVNGAYPQRLKQLDSTIAEKDWFHGLPYRYEHTDDGFLLYSAGPNGTDDGGSMAESEWGAARYQGASVNTDTDDDPRAQKIPAGADDFALRVPVEWPPWPWEPVITEERRRQKSARMYDD